MTKIDLLNVADMRGENREILYTQTFLVDDNEEIKWRISICNKLIRLKLKFTPMKGTKQNPDISVFHQEGESIIEFIGWNVGTTYRILDPLEIREVGDWKITFSVVNTHLGTSNICVMQVYREALD